MFGDGALLINQAAASFIGIPVPDRVTPLDSMLRSTSLTRSQGAGIGARVSHRLAPRIRAELEFEATPTSLSFTQASVDQMEATAASFVTVWNEIFASRPGIMINRGVTATVVPTDPGRVWQMSLTGGISYRVWGNRRVAVSATGAGGIIRRPVALPEATLTGTYQFTHVGTIPFLGLVTLTPMAEQDLIRVHFARRSIVPVVAAGGTVKYFVTPRSGLRADVRIYASTTSMDTLVDAAPVSAPGTPLLLLAPFGTNPDLAFTNQAPSPGSLSVPLTNFKTFTASGPDVQASVTVGYFFRF
jgi:hypothetical protein